MSRAEDLSGQSFGKLTVVDRDFTKTRRTYWNCKCKCGVEKSIAADKLKKSRRCCGCTSRIILDPGTKFNKLTTIEEVKPSRWACSCECGKKIEIKASRLKSGHTKSCGCLLIESRKRKNPNLSILGKVMGRLKVLSHDINTSKYFCECISCGRTTETKIANLNKYKETELGCRSCSRKKNLKDKVFGELTVLEDSGETNLANGIYWTCKCSCGTIKNILSGSLVNGTSKSCGCRKRGSQTHGSIYGIYTECGQLKYVGQTINHNIENRFKKHKSNPHSNSLKQFFKENKNTQIKPILENVLVEYLDKVELYFIKELLKTNTLLNIKGNQ